MENKCMMSPLNVALAIMDILDINEVEFANRMGWTKDVMDSYLEDDVEITPEMAAKFDEVFNLNRVVWQIIKIDYLGVN